MTYKLFGWIASGAIAAAAALFVLRMTNVITTLGSAYIWSNRSFIALATLAICSSVLYVGGQVWNMTRDVTAVSRWSRVLLSCLGVLCLEAVCFLYASLGINFMGQ